MSVRNCDYLLRNYPEERSSQNLTLTFKLTVLPQAELVLRLRQHCQFLMSAFFLKNTFENELIKKKQTAINSEILTL